MAWVGLPLGTVYGTVLKVVFYKRGNFSSQLCSPELKIAAENKSRRTEKTSHTADQFLSAA